MINTIVVLQLKFTLVGIRPAIWRRILVPADYTFFGLHVAIQDAFGWEDAHLHQFFTENPYKRNSQYQCITYPDREMEDFREIIDERKAKLRDWLNTPKQTMLYEYDFGDSWMHEIKLEEILQNDSGVKYPQILEGARACPPEDCGGIGGYEHLLEILTKPKHPEHADMLEWLGIGDAKEFDPEYFNKEKIHFRNPQKALRELEKLRKR